MFFLGLEMVLDIVIFKHDHQTENSTPVVPLAFPLIAGAGSMTTLISLNAVYARVNIISGILLNLIVVLYRFKIFSIYRQKNWNRRKFNSEKILWNYSFGHGDQIH